MFCDLTTAVGCYIKFGLVVAWNYQEVVESVSAVVVVASFLVTVEADVASGSVTFVPRLVLKGQSMTLMSGQSEVCLNHC